MRTTYTGKGWVERVLTTALLAGVLAASHPEDAWVWVVLGAAFAGWLAGVLLMVRNPRWSTAGLLLAAFLSALVVGLPGSSAMVITAMALVMIAAQAPLRTPTIVAISIGCAVVVGLSAWRGAQSSNWFFGYLALMSVLVLLGLNRRQFEAQSRQTADLLLQTRLAQQEHARAAALDERGRIARELHDVLAHSLGALSVQLEVAEALLADRQDTAGALDRVRRSRRLAVEGLTEARNAVAALRADVPPLPEALAALVDQHRADHAVEVTLEHRGTTRLVPSGPTVALLGATREALTNAAKHAPGRPVDVQLDFRAEAVRVVVRDAGTPAGPGSSGGVPGFGLTGMRERLALVGGTLTAGRTEGRNGWQVVAEVPHE